MALPSWFVLVAVAVVATVTFFSVGFIAPVLPQHLIKVHLDVAWSGVIFAAYSVGAIAIAAPANAFVARCGRLVPLCIGLLTQAISVLAFGWFNDSLIMFLLSRFCQGCGSGITTLAIYAIATDHYQHEDVSKVTSVSEFFTGVGFAFGNLLGGILFDSFGFLGMFTFASAFLAGAAVLAIPLQFLPTVVTKTGDNLDSTKESDDSTAIARLRHVCTGDLIASALPVLNTMALWGVIDAGAYTVHASQALAMGVVAIGYQLASSTLTYTLLSIPIGLTTDPRRYQYYGLLLNIISLLGMGPLAPALCLMSSTHQVCERWVEFFFLCFLGISNALMMIPGMASMMQRLDSESSLAKDACITIYSLSMQIGTILGPLISSAFIETYEIGMSCLACSTGFITILFMRQIYGKCSARELNALEESFLAPKSGVAADVKVSEVWA